MDDPVLAEIRRAVEGKYMYSWESWLANCKMVLSRLDEANDMLAAREQRDG